MATAMAATRSVYESPGVRFCKRGGQFSVRAETDLDVGALVLVEHVFSGTYPELHALLFMDERLRRELHPRSAPAEEGGGRDDDEDDDDAGDSERNGEKIAKNAFDFGGDMVVGARICKFNHSCKPNAYLNVVDHVRNLKFYGVWTVAKVRRGEELTFDYANGHGEAHDAMRDQHGFVCSCSAEDVARCGARAKIELGLATSFALARREEVGVHVDAYLDRWGPKVSAAQARVRKFAREHVRVGG